MKQHCDLFATMVAVRRVLVLWSTTLRRGRILCCQSRSLQTHASSSSSSAAAAASPAGVSVGHIGLPFSSALQPTKSQSPLPDRQTAPNLRSKRLRNEEINATCEREQQPRLEGLQINGRRMMASLHESCEFGKGHRYGRCVWLPQAIEKHIYLSSPWKGSSKLDSG